MFVVLIGWSFLKICFYKNLTYVHDEGAEVQLRFPKGFKSMILGLCLIISGFLSFASIGITMELFGEDITRHYRLVLLGFILIIFGIVSTYFFIRKE